MTLSDQEEVAAARLRTPLLEEMSEVVVDCANLLRSLALVAEEDVAHHIAAAVHRALLSRLADELLALRLLARTGYAFQAASLAAGAFEIAFTAAHVAWSESRARKWLQHRELHERPYENVPFRAKATAKEVLVARGWTEKEVSGFVLWYTGMCMAKHANPILTAQAMAAFTDAGHILRADPSITKTAVSQAASALYVGLLVATFPLLAFVDKCPLPSLTRAQWEAVPSFVARVGVFAAE